MKERNSLVLAAVVAAEVPNPIGQAVRVDTASAMRSRASALTR